MISFTMCFCAPTVHIKPMHSHKQTAAWKQHTGPAWCFFDGKQSAKTGRNNLTERENVTVCIRRPCTFDTCDWGSVIEAYFEGKGRGIIKACFRKHRQISAQDALSDWKQIGFIANATPRVFTYQDAHKKHRWFSLIFGNAHTLLCFRWLYAGVSWTDQDSFCYSLSLQVWGYH